MTTKALFIKKIDKLEIIKIKNLYSVKDIVKSIKKKLGSIHPIPVHVLMAALIIIIPNRKQLTCPSAVEWIRTPWYIRTL